MTDGERRGNLLVVSFGRLLVAVSSFVVNVAVARTLAREDFGTYRWIWSVAVVGAFVADLGLWQLLTRQVARDATGAGRRVGVALQATAALSVVTLLAIGVYVGVADGRVDAVLAALLAGGTVCAIAAAHHVQAAFYGLRRMVLELPSLVASRLAFVAGSLAVVALGGGLVSLYAARLLSGAVLLAWVVVTFRRAIGPLGWTSDRDELRAWVAHGRVYGAPVLFGAVIAQADVLLIERLSTTTEVARYAAPASVLLQLGMVPNILTSGLFPRIARLSRGEAELRRLLAFQTRVLLAVSVPVAVGGAVLAEPIVTWMFGAAYSDAAWPFVALIVAVPLRFLHNGYGVALTALDLAEARARVGAVAAGVNVVGNLVAIPLLGAEGAAVVIVLTDLVLLAGVRRALGGEIRAADEAAAWVRTLLPALGMAAVVVLVDGPHVVARIVLGAVVYAVLALGTGGIERGDAGRLHGV